MKERRGKEDIIHIIFRMFGFVGRNKIPFFFCVTVGATMPLYESVLVGNTVSELTKACTNKDIIYLKKTIITMLFMFLGYLLYTFCYAYVYTNFVKIALDIKNTLFRHVIKLPMTYFNANTSGDISSRMISDYNKAVELVGYPMFGQANPISLLLSIIVVSVLVIHRNMLLGIVSISVSLVNMFLINILSVKLQKHELQIKKVIASSTQKIIDLLSGTIVARIFHLEHILQNKYEDEIETIYQKIQTLNRKKSLISMLIDFQQFLSFAGVIGVGLVLQAKGIIVLADVMYISSMQSFLANYVAQFSQKFSQLQTYIAGAYRILELLDSKEEMIRKDQEPIVPSQETAIEMSNINFSYPNQEKKIFEDFTMKIKRGEHIGIVGNSGEGKSTLLKLLLEFEVYGQGNTSFFGTDRLQCSQMKIRDLCTYVPQQPYLYHASIKENILLDHQGSDKEVWDVLQLACLKDYVESLPDGIHTIVGEGGHGLSGGQKQKISIARALFFNKPIILMDEATSSLDVNSEEEIQKAFDNLSKGRTCIVIAHRLSTIKNMDRILVLKAGKIVEEGTNDELMKKGGIYTELYQKQYSI